MSDKPLTDIKKCRADNALLKRTVELCMAARQELLGRLEARDAEIDRLTEALDMYRNGYQGACMACEPVGKQNQKLREACKRKDWVLLWAQLRLSQFVHNTDGPGDFADAIKLVEEIKSELSRGESDAIRTDQG